MPEKKRSKTVPTNATEADHPDAGDSKRRQPTSERMEPEASKPAGLKAAAREAATDQPAAEMTSATEKVRAEEARPAESLHTELQEAKDRALRTQAELENYRKRVARETREQHRYADLPLMRDLLPVLDNMDRAIEAAEKTHDTASLLEGVKMVARQLEEVLQRHDCVRIRALNEPFDPHLHEAISQQPSDEHPAGTVVLETQTGFQLHDRVVRPSQVIVSTTDRTNDDDGQ